MTATTWTDSTAPGQSGRTATLTLELLLVEPPEGAEFDPVLGHGWLPVRRLFLRNPSGNACADVQRDAHVRTGTWHSIPDTIPGPGWSLLGESPAGVSPADVVDRGSWTMFPAPLHGILWDVIRPMLNTLPAGVAPKAPGV